MINHYDHDRLSEKDLQIISPENDGFHYFFGYYDLPATDKNGENHLCHRVAFMDRLPTADDVCELGILKDRKFYPFAETTAWNFQQGSMLRWHPTKENTVCYNVRRNAGFSTVVHDLSTGNKLFTDRACATIAPNGKDCFGETDNGNLPPSGVPNYYSVIGYTRFDMGSKRMHHVEVFGK